MSTNGKRGPGRPPGPCPTPYHRFGSFAIAKTVGIPDPPPARTELTPGDVGRLTGFLAGVDGLVREAQSGNGTAEAARAELATRFKCAVGSGGLRR